MSVKHHIIVVENPLSEVTAFKGVAKRLEMMLTAKKMDDVIFESHQFAIEAFSNAIYFTSSDTIYFDVDMKNLSIIFKEHIMNSQVVKNLESNIVSNNEVFLAQLKIYNQEKMNAPIIVLDVDNYVQNNDYKGLGKVLKDIRPLKVHHYQNDYFKDVKAIELNDALKKHLNILDAKQLEFESTEELEHALKISQSTIVLNDINLVQVLQVFLTYVVDKSCGKCTPCREGSKRLLDYTNKSLNIGINDFDYSQMKQLAALMFQTSLCPFGPNSSIIAVNLFKYFDHEFNPQYKKVDIKPIDHHNFQGGEDHDRG